LRKLHIGSPVRLAATSREPPDDRMLSSLAAPRCQTQPGAGGSSVAGRPPAGVRTHRQWWPSEGARTAARSRRCPRAYRVRARTPQPATGALRALREAGVARRVLDVRRDRERPRVAAAQQRVLDVGGRALDPDVGEQAAVAVARLAPDPQLDAPPLDA